MRINTYLGYMAKDFLQVCGAVTLLFAAALSVFSWDWANDSLLIQVLLISAGITCFKYALANKYEQQLPKLVQRISFMVTFVMADLFIVLWLWLYSPGKLMDQTLMLGLIIVVVLGKGLVYYLMYQEDRRQAKAFNVKLDAFKKGKRERS